MNTFIIIAAIVCITIMVIFACIMGKQAKSINTLLRAFDYSMQGYIENIVNACNNTKHAVKDTGEILDSRLKAVYADSKVQAKACTECLVREVDEVINRIQVIEKQAKEGIKVAVCLQPLPLPKKTTPAPAPKKQSKRETEKIAKADEKETEARKIYKRAVKLREEGKSFRAIAEELGYKSGRSIDRIIKRGIERNW